MDITTNQAITDDGFLDLAEIIYLEQISDDATTDTDRAQDIALDYALDGMDNPSRTYFVSRISGTPAGYVISEDRGVVLVGKWIFVLPEHRRKGIGMELTNALTAYARENNFRNVLAEIDGANFPSRSLTRKAGFEFEGTENGYWARYEL